MRLNYLIRRVFFLFMVVWTAATINFILPHLTGRDPIKEMMVQQIASQGRKSADAQIMIDKYTQLFGLDKPLWQQYLTFLSHLLRGDLVGGESRALDGRGEDGAGVARPEEYAETGAVPDDLAAAEVECVDSADAGVNVQARGVLAKSRQHPRGADEGIIADEA